MAKQRPPSKLRIALEKAVHEVQAMRDILSSKPPDQGSVCHLSLVNACSSEVHHPLLPVKSAPADADVYAVRDNNIALPSPGYSNSYSNELFAHEAVPATLPPSQQRSGGVHGEPVPAGSPVLSAPGTLIPSTAEPPGRPAPLELHEQHEEVCTFADSDDEMDVIPVPSSSPDQPKSRSGVDFARRVSSDVVVRDSDQQSKQLKRAASCKVHASCTELEPAPVPQPLPPSTRPDTPRGGAPSAFSKQRFSRPPPAGGGGFGTSLRSSLDSASAAVRKLAVSGCFATPATPQPAAAGHPPAAGRTASRSSYQGVTGTSAKGAPVASKTKLAAAASMPVPGSTQGRQGAVGVGAGKAGGCGGGAKAAPRQAANLNLAVPADVEATQSVHLQPSSAGAACAFVALQSSYLSRTSQAMVLPPLPVPGHQADYVTAGDRAVRTSTETRR